ncbi:MAG TPA: hypothetical protein VHS36_02035 [Candidatus Limnocylindrales bacterium]|jgi:hypothetical protein|nr:hypothetical protein [Candidatus Limnocylindrales bacterium]
MRYLRSFGAFWYDFLIGDRPELFVGSIVVLGLVWVAIRVGLEPVAAGGLLIVLVVLLGGLSIWSAIRPRS